MILQFVKSCTFLCTFNADETGQKRIQQPPAQSSIGNAGLHLYSVSHFPLLTSPTHDDTIFLENCISLDFLKHGHSTMAIPWTINVLSTPWVLAWKCCRQNMSLGKIYFTLLIKTKLGKKEFLKSYIALLRAELNCTIYASQMGR